MNGRNVTALTAVLLFSTLTASAKSYTAERYLVDLNLTPQGILEVTETVRFAFHGGPFTYVLRDIATRELDHVEGIRTMIDGQPFDAEVEGARIRWKFPELINETHTYTVQYRVRGVVRHLPEGDVLRWHALPDRRGYPTNAAEIRFRFAQGTKLPLITMSPSKPVGISGSEANVTYSDLRDRTDVILSAKFPPGTFSSDQPEWLARKESRKQEALAAIPVALFGVLAVVLWTESLRKRGAPEPYRELLNVGEPPSSLSPARASRLIGGQGIFPALLLDFARRGIVQIEEQKRTWTGRHFQLTWNDRGQPLLPHERMVLESAFRKDRTITLSSYYSYAGQSSRRISKAIADELDAMGLTDPARRHTQNELNLIAGGFMLAGFGLIVGFAVFERTSLGVAGVASVIAAFISFIAAGRTSVLTGQGVIEAARWKSYKKYLKTAPEGLDLDTALPFAAGFAIAGTLASTLKARGVFRMPPWFAAFDGGGDGSDAFVSFVSAGDSSGYGGGGGDGGGGASGGGSSSAG